MQKKKNPLSMIGFVSITIAMVMDVYEYPIFATSGLQLVFFLIVDGLLWFIPPASITAGETSIYLVILILSALLALVFPFIIYHFNDKSLHKTIILPKHMSSDETNKFLDGAYRGEHHISPDKEDYL